MSDSLAAERLYANLVLLEQLADYATNPRINRAPVLPGLDTSQDAFLRTAEGAGAAASWLRAFHGALNLLRDFRSADLAGQLRYDTDAAAEKDLLDALKASNTALSAAASRIGFLAGRATPEPQPDTKSA